MNRRVASTLGLLFLLVLPLSRTFAQTAPMEKSATDKPVALRANDVAFNDISVPGFPAGLKIAVLAGDPSQPAAYTLRLKFPDGYQFPPHWHPALEHVTIVSGTFYLGMGDTVDKSAAQAYHPGDFLVAPPHMSHFGWVKGETVVQLHGTGPFVIKLAGEQ